MTTEMETTKTVTHGRSAAKCLELGILRYVLICMHVKIGQICHTLIIPFLCHFPHIYIIYSESETPGLDEEDPRGPLPISAEVVFAHFSYILA